MAKEFVLGARLDMGTTKYVSQVKNAYKQTKEFRSITEQAGGSMKKYAGATNNAEKETREFGNEAKKASGSLGGLKKIAAAAFAAFGVKKGFDWLIQGNADMETYQNTLAVVMKDSVKAAETLEWATGFAAKTPFEIPGVVEATTKLTAYGLEAKSTLGIVGDMAAVMGKDLMQAVEAVADAQTGEVERLKEFGITKKMIEDQAKMMKVTVTNNSGQITDQKAFNAVLFSIMEDRFKGGMDLQSKTFKGMISNAKDFMSATGRQLGKPIFDKLKEGLGGALTQLNKLKDSGAIDKVIGKVQKIGGIVWSEVMRNYRMIRDTIRVIMKKFNEFYSENKPQIEKLGRVFVEAFTLLRTYADKAISWINTTGLPKLLDLLKDVGGWVIDVAVWFIDNWKPIEPFIMGIATAWIFFKGVCLAWYGVMQVVTAAQWLFNAALAANPIGIVIVAIGLLIGAGILLVRNWEKVSQGASDLWIGITNFFKSGINEVIDDVNRLIALINQIPGIEIGQMKRIALDMSVQTRKNGEEMALRRSGEEVVSPSQGRIINAAGKTREIPTNKVQITKLFEKLEVHAAPGMDEDALANNVITKLYDKISEADDVISNGNKRGLLD